jgi:hypothetical protein
MKIKRRVKYKGRWFDASTGEVGDTEKWEAMVDDPNAPEEIQGLAAPGEHEQHAIDTLQNEIDAMPDNEPG